MTCKHLRTRSVKQAAGVHRLVQECGSCGSRRVFLNPTLAAGGWGPWTIAPNGGVRGRGRPPLKPQDKRTIQVKFKVSRAEKAQIDASCGGQKVASWCRDQALNACS